MNDEASSAEARGEDPVGAARPDHGPQQHGPQEYAPLDQGLPERTPLEPGCLAASPPPSASPDEAPRDQASLDREPLDEAPLDHASVEEVRADYGLLPEHARVNRQYWDGMAAQWIAAGERQWQAAEPNWGIWGLPESQLRLLPVDMRGMRTIELGCGTAYVSAWMARRGAAVTGIDNSHQQLATARRLAAAHGVALELHHGNAETVPLPDGAFDFAISEYGAAIWCDPYKWIPEAHRLLVAGGQLVFLGNSTLAQLCSPADGSLPLTERLERDYFGMHRFDWRDAADDPGGIEFNLPVGEWFRLLRDTGFQVLDFLELRAPAPGSQERYGVRADWAYRFPAEQAWRARKI